MCLQVNGVEMSGKSQEDVVSYLRNIKFGSVVNIIVSRTDADRPVQHAVPTSTVVIHSLYNYIIVGYTRANKRFHDIIIIIYFIN